MTSFWQILEITEYRAQLSEYLKNRMAAVAPNLSVLVGDIVGARLISHAGLWTTRFSLNLPCTLGLTSYSKLTRNPGNLFIYPLSLVGGEHQRRNGHGILLVIIDD